MITRRKLWTMLASAAGAIGLGGATSISPAQASLDAAMLANFPGFLKPRAPSTYEQFCPEIAITLDKMTGNLLVNGREPGGVELAYAVTHKALRDQSAFVAIAEMYNMLKEHLWHAMTCEAPASCSICRSYSDATSAGLPVGTVMRFHQDAAPSMWTLVEKADDGTILCAYSPGDMASFRQWDIGT